MAFDQPVVSLARLGPGVGQSVLAPGCCGDPNRTTVPVSPGTRHRHGRLSVLGKCCCDCCYGSTLYAFLVPTNLRHRVSDAGGVGRLSRGSYRCPQKNPKWISRVSLEGFDKESGTDWEFLCRADGKWPASREAGDMGQDRKTIEENVNLKRRAKNG